MTDEELVAGFKTGDELAFEQLVVRYQREVYRLAYRVVNDHAEAHDLSQEVFIRVYKGLGSFRGDAAFRTWLYRIAINAGLNHLRQRRPVVKQAVALDAAQHLGVFNDPSTRLEQERQQSRLRGAIQRLPPKQRETLILKVYKELRFKDIARVMSCSVGTAKANMFHAVANLRRLISQEQSHDEV